MCGICGFFGLDDKILIKKMNERLHHRGPDHTGYYIDEKGKVALGAKRLSIIDIVSGNQPISNEDESIYIVFNGEIYNFLELKEQLYKKGHKFKTNSDTEVILHLYEDYQENCVELLRGMFAFAIYDKNNKKLFLARDRIGIKPLYYSLYNGKLYFASEIKSLLETEIPKDIDYNALDYYITFGYIPFSLSIFKWIKKLEPAHFLIYQNNNVKIEKYWDVDFTSYKTNYEEIINEMGLLLEEIIKIHTISDVPIGVFLSGGLDSSVVAALTTKVLGKINTFTIGYEKKYSEFDESKYARIVANHINSNHYEFILTDKEIMEYVPILPQYFDEPFADYCSLATFFLSKKNKRKN
jgi:asparagine synthase (glutamine-hydrolysing)